jgi:hypothetical protein
MSTNPLPLSWLREPLVDPKTGRASRGFDEWLRKQVEAPLAKTITRNPSAGPIGQIQSVAVIQGRTEPVSATLQNLNANGQLKTADNIAADGSTFGRVSVAALTANQVDLTKAGVLGLLGSVKLNRNIMLNYSNNATVDSIDNGTNATIRVYGAGGVGTSWHQFIGSVIGPENPSFSGAFAYNTTYIVYYDGTTYFVVPTSTAFMALKDGILFAATLHTVSAGGGGGSSGGGGTGGGGGGRLSAL